MTEKARSRYNASRRGLLKTISPAVGLAIAGCTGGDGDGDSDGGDGGGSPDGDGGGGTATTAPPEEEGLPFDTVELQNWSEAGGTFDLRNGMLASVLPEYYPGDIQTRTASYPGAQGLVGANKFHQEAAPNKLAMIVPDTIAFLHQQHEEILDWEPRDFKPVGEATSGIMTIMINPRSTDVPAEPAEGIWYWSWDDFVQKAGDLKLAGLNPSHEFGIRALEFFSNELEPGTVDFINFEGFGSMRTAIRRGDLDGYVTEFFVQMRPERLELYLPQFLFGTRDQLPMGDVETVNEQIGSGSAEDIRVLGEEPNFPQDGARTLGLLTKAESGWVLHNSNSDRIYQAHADAYTGALPDERYKAAIEDVDGTLLGRHTTNVGEEVAERWFETYDAIIEYSDQIGV